MRPKAGSAALLMALASITATPAHAQQRLPGEGQFDVVIAEARAAMLVDPAVALNKAALAEKAANGIADAKARRVAQATTLWLQAEADYRINRSEEAWPRITRALKLAVRDAPGSKLHGDILLTRGSLHGVRGEPGAALNDFQAAHAIYQRIHDARAQAISLLCIASLYGDANDHLSALKYSGQALEVYQGDPNLSLSIYNNQASDLQDLGRYSEAEGQYHRALDIARQLGSDLLTARILGNLARVYLKAGHPGAAGRAVNEALALTRSRDAASGVPQLQGIAAQVALEQGDAQRAAALIRQRFAGVDLATTTMPSREAHYTAYKIFEKLGDVASALPHLQALKRLDDQATQLATSATMALAAARFDFANQELRIANLQRDEAKRSVAFEQARARTQRNIFIGSAAGTALVIALLTLGLVTLRRSRNQIRLANRDLAVTNTALGKALAAKTEFLATTSHEIRTPLNGILGMTQVMLADGQLAADTRDRLHVVHAAGTAMRTLVDDILDVAKMESGKLTVEEAPFDLRATLTDVARMWREQAEAKGLTFTLDVEDAPDLIVGDVARVRQIVFNLLSNALKFTAHGRIGLSAAREDERVRITVEDTGIGIPAAKQEEVFESFRQADAGTTRQFGGTGLGLSICRNIAEALGGTVTLRSSEGAGSAFTVWLPHVAAERASPKPAVEAQADCEGVLILDRNPISRAMLKTLVTTRGCSPRLAATAEEAHVVLDEASITHVIVDDSSLRPVADGADVLADLVESARSHGAAVSLLWAGEVPEAIARAGADQLLAKPIAGAVLLDRVFGARGRERSDPALVSHAA